jgi:16S rRNA (guanine527-N7)-methyltransferase
MQLIHRYFPHLSVQQKEQFDSLVPLYKEWNSKINVISRKDIDELDIRHVLHSLAIAKFTQFTPASQILDVGTGGGFPGIPLAICFPEVQFHLIDSIGKKIKVVKEVASALQLSNVSAEQVRVENLNTQFDFIVSRAVTAFPDFVKLCSRRIKKEQKNAIPNGILYLKGGDFQHEITPFGKRAYTMPLSQYFEESFFETKKLIHLAM